MRRKSPSRAIISTAWDGLAVTSSEMALRELNKKCGCNCADKVDIRAFASCTDNTASCAVERRERCAVIKSAIAMRPSTYAGSQKRNNVSHCAEVGAIEP